MAKLRKTSFWLFLLVSSVFAQCPTPFLTSYTWSCVECVDDTECSAMVTNGCGTGICDPTWHRCERYDPLPDGCCNPYGDTPEEIHCPAVPLMVASCVPGVSTCTYATEAMVTTTCDISSPYYAPCDAGETCVDFHAEKGLHCAKAPYIERPCQTNAECTDLAFFPYAAPCVWYTPSAGADFAPASGFCMQEAIAFSRACFNEAAGCPGDDAPGTPQTVVGAECGPDPSAPEITTCWINCTNDWDCPDPYPHVSPYVNATSVCVDGTCLFSSEEFPIPYCNAADSFRCTDSDDNTDDYCTPQSGMCHNDPHFCTDDANCSVSGCRVSSCIGSTCMYEGGSLVTSENRCAEEGDGCEIHHCNIITDTCIDVEARMCEDGSAFTVGICEPIETPPYYVCDYDALGDKCTNATCDDGHGCTDNFCNADSGQCQHSTRVQSLCMDFNPCTISSCDPEAPICGWTGVDGDYASYHSCCVHEPKCTVVSNDTMIAMCDITTASCYEVPKCADVHCDLGFQCVPWTGECAHCIPPYVHCGGEGEDVICGLCCNNTMCDNFVCDLETYNCTDECAEGYMRCYDPDRCSGCCEDDNCTGLHVCDDATGFCNASCREEALDCGDGMCGYCCNNADCQGFVCVFDNGLGECSTTCEGDLLDCGTYCASCCNYTDCNYFMCNSTSYGAECNSTCVTGLHSCGEYCAECCNNTECLNHICDPEDHVCTDECVVNMTHCSDGWCHDCCNNSNCNYYVCDPEDHNCTSTCQDGFYECTGEGLCGECCSDLNCQYHICNMTTHTCTNECPEGLVQCAGWCRECCSNDDCDGRVCQWSAKVCMSICVDPADIFCDTFCGECCDDLDCPGTYCVNEPNSHYCNDTCVAGMVRCDAGCAECCTDADCPGTFCTYPPGYCTEDCLPGLIDCGDYCGECCDDEWCNGFVCDPVNHTCLSVCGEGLMDCGDHCGACCENADCGDYICNRTSYTCTVVCANRTHHSCDDNTHCEECCDDTHCAYHECTIPGYTCNYTKCAPGRLECGEYCGECCVDADCHFYMCNPFRLSCLTICAEGMHVCPGGETCGICCNDTDCGSYVCDPATASCTELCPDGTHDCGTYCGQCCNDDECGGFLCQTPAHNCSVTTCSPSLHLLELPEDEGLACVECVTQDHCPDRHACNSSTHVCTDVCPLGQQEFDGVCYECTNSSHCHGFICDDGVCTTSCLAPNVHCNTYCGECCTDVNCDDDEFCDVVTGVCVDKCPTNQTYCGIYPDGYCGSCCSHSDCINGTEYCDPVSHACASVPNCTPTNLCNVGRFEFLNSSCVEDPKCHPPDFCHVVSCNPAVGICLYPERDCSDDDACSVDTCDVEAEECVHTSNCDDGNLCTLARCLDTGCQYYYPAYECSEGSECYDPACMRYVCLDPATGAHQWVFSSLGVECEFVPRVISMCDGHGHCVPPAGKLVTCRTKKTSSGQRKKVCKVIDAY